LQLDATRLALEWQGKPLARGFQLSALSFQQKILATVLKVFQAQFVRGIESVRMMLVGGSFY
jgi:hypothetical protein